MRLWSWKEERKLFSFVHLTGLDERRSLSGMSGHSVFPAWVETSHGSWPTFPGDQTNLLPVTNSSACLSLLLSISLSLLDEASRYILHIGGVRVIESL
jgi:hypothetical protein